MEGSEHLKLLPKYDEKTGEKVHDICYGSSYSISNTWEEFKCQKNDMSLIYSLRIGDAVYVATDSRSTIAHNDNNGIRKEFDDTYRKIARIPNTNIYFSASGVNMYNGKNLAELTAECKTKEDVINIIKKYDTNLFVFSYNDNNIECALYHGETKRIILLGESNYFSTSTELIGLLENLKVPHINDDLVVTEYINDVFTIAMIGSKWGDKTVGGPIHILKLMPGKPHTWLQNGYDL